MNKNDQEFIAQRIRAKYVEKETTDLTDLCSLDKKVSRPADVFAYVFGTVGALVLGTGMCLAMKVIGDAMLAGVVIGCVGIAMVSSTYALYKKILSGRRAKYRAEIERLSEKILADES